MEVIPIDLNGNGKIDPDENFYENTGQVMKAIKDGKYPSPPARDSILYQRENQRTRGAGIPKWVLTDGQKYVPEAGYVTLLRNRSVADRNLTKLN